MRLTSDFLRGSSQELGLRVGSASSVRRIAVVIHGLSQLADFYRVKCTVYCRSLLLRFISIKSRAIAHYVGMCCGLAAFAHT